MTFRDVPLRRVARIVNGGIPTADAANWSGDVAWATPVDLGRVGLHIETTDRTLTQAGLESGSRAVPAGSVLLSTRAPIGHLAITRVPMAFNQGCRGLVPGDDIDVRFLAYQLLAKTADLKAAGQGSTFMELSSEALSSVRICLPPLDAQRRIADFLDEQVHLLDRGVSLRLEQKALLAERHEAEIDIFLRPDGLSTPDVAARHVVERMGVGIVIQPAALYTEDREDSVPAVRGKDITPGVIAPERTLVRITRAGHAANRRSELQRGDILVVRSGKAGAAAQVPENLIGGNCIDVVIVRPGERLDSRYAEYSINCRRAQETVMEHATGAIQRHFGVEDMKAMPIVVRPIEEQRRIARVLDDLTERHRRANALLDESLRLLRERKQVLMGAAVAGAFDVTTARSAA